MAYSREDINKVRDSADIVEIISEKVGLKRKGSRYSGLCPFHKERTPSFSVNPEMGLYYCFGCQEKGDVFSFLEKTQNYSFVEALEFLATKYNIHIVDTKDVSNKYNNKENIYKILDSVREFYNKQFLEDKSAGKARSFIRSKGFGKEDVEEFNIGFSKDYDGLINFLESKKFTKKDLLDSGAVLKKNVSTSNKINSYNDLYDPMAKRIIFPISNSRGQVIAFGGRALPNDEQTSSRGKYRNTHETNFYKKSREFYALDIAKKYIVSNNQVVICEGYTDVMAFHKQGIKYAIATCGTAVTNEHIKVLKNYSKKIILAYDADSAGQKAIEKWYDWEEEYDLELLVMEFPNGMDPCDFMNSKGGHLLDLVENAKSITQHKVDQVFSSNKIDSIEDRTRVVSQLSKILKPIKNNIVFNLYLEQISKKLNISKNLLVDEINNVKIGKTSIVETQKIANPIENMSSAEVALLHILIVNPLGLEEFVNERWFNNSHCKGIFNVIVQESDSHEIEKYLSPEDQILFNEIVQNEIEVDKPYAYGVAAKIVVGNINSIYKVNTYEDKNEMNIFVDRINNFVSNGQWIDVFNTIRDLHQRYEEDDDEVAE